MNADIFLCYFLAFLTPTLSFCSLNTQFFTKSQIVYSLCLAGALGSCAGIFCAWLLSAYGSSAYAFMLPPLAVLCFCLLNERFFSEIFSKTAQRAAVIGGMIGVSLFTAWFWGSFITNMLLAIYGLFAAYDITKNWNRSKTPIFDPELMRPIQTPKKHILFKKRPNVYVLLLESTHSCEALKKIYDIDEQRVEDFLHKNNFTIYRNIFSNKHSTPLSLKTLLSMSLDYTSRPHVLENFIDNGYKCYFFDSMYYLSQPYVNYISNEDVKIPLAIRKIYTYIGAFFAQSKWIRCFVKGIDPFQTDNTNKSFSEMRDDLNKSFSENSTDKKINIIHFGAQHFGDLWYRIYNAVKVYKMHYERAVNELQIITDDILEHDPDALIIAVGDHGAYHWNGVHEGGGAPEENAQANGVTPEQLAYDFFGVVLGIHWGGVLPPKPVVLSHVNIFRWVMAALAGQDTPDSEEENISILNGQYVAVRDGEPLEKYEILANKRYSDYYISAIADTVLLERTKQLELKLINKDLSDIDRYTTALFDKAKDTHEYSLQHFNAAQALVKSGRVHEAAVILDGYYNSYLQKIGYEPFTFIVNFNIFIKKYNKAKEIIYKALENPRFPHSGPMELLSLILFREKKYNNIVDMAQALINTQRNLVCEPFDRFYYKSMIISRAIEYTHGYSEAIIWIDDKIKNNNLSAINLYSLLIQKISFYQKYEFENVPRELLNIINAGHEHCGFISLCLRAATIVGDKGLARDMYAKLNEKYDFKENIIPYIVNDEYIENGTPKRISSIKAKNLIAKSILDSGLFDSDWYENECHPDTSPILDYLKNGVALLRNPNSTFDISYYNSVMPHVFLSGIDPIIHYMNDKNVIPVSLEDDVFSKMYVYPEFQNINKE